MNYYDHLVMRARSYWGNDQELPLELFSEMIAVGIDVQTEEEKYNDSY